VSNEARHRDIVALLARGVIRVKKWTTVAKTDKSPISAAQAGSSLPPNPVNIEPDALPIQAKDGGDQ
jgi:hypothetical protein